ncbi:MAG: hypothetical protein HYX87_08375 [Chloroflexi bacterium]|nr:hypothetical protein [Chloroflexota bacterium]
MRSSNRLLLAFGAIAATLVIVAAVLVFTRGNEGVVQLPASDPGGVVQRYIQALQTGDIEAAQKYLATPIAGKPSPGGRPLPDSPGPAPVSPGQGPRPSPRTDVNWRAVLTDTRIQGDVAEVTITVYVFRPSGPFDDPVRTYTQVFSLVRENSTWRIANPEWLWWLY